VHDFSGEVQNFSGEVQNNLRGGAHLPSKSGLGGGCKRAKIIVIILFQPYISTDFLPFTRKKMGMTPLDLCSMVPAEYNTWLFKAGLA
jgi:hypothetical protein